VPRVEDGIQALNLAASSDNKQNEKVEKMLKRAHKAKLGVETVEAK